MNQSHPSLKLLVLGGARSGKSAYAQRRAEALAGQGRGAELVFVATAQARDGEMAARVAAHRAARGPRWRTLEEPLALAEALAEAGPAQVVLVDCLTLWLSNWLERGPVQAEAAVAALPGAVAGCRADLILVSNEVGWGIVPDNPLARTFRDLSGRLHQELARVCAEALLVVAGLSLKLK